jgi:hypothetical protein
VLVHAVEEAQSGRRRFEQALVIFGAGRVTGRSVLR